MPLATQRHLFDDEPKRDLSPPRGQLLKWIGNKQRMAVEIASYFPIEFGAYHEPFLGSGALLATVAPRVGYGSDSFGPLIQIWQALRADPDSLKQWYAERWHKMHSGDKRAVYEMIKASFNESPNGPDLLFLCRACYGGVVRFRKRDGYMSTPCGAHNPISPSSFSKRVDEWHRRVRTTIFHRLEFEESMRRAGAGDLVYCDPPYSDTQAILYGAQNFSLERLFAAISACKKRGVYVALSIDGTKKSGARVCDVEIPPNLFKREVLIERGRSMLKRFQMAGRSLERELVSDRLLLTY